LYGRENLGGFWDVSLKNPKQIEKNSKKGMGFDPKTPP